MTFKSIVFQVFTHAVLLAGTAHTVCAAGFKSGDKVYTAGSIGIIRTAPRNDAPIAARIPIGTFAEFIGSPAEVASGPNKQCPEADAKGDARWSCVRFNNLVVEQGSLTWSGWIATELLSSEAPKLKDLLFKYDNTAPDNLSERRKWAERAAALDPTAPDSQERLLEVFRKMNDTKALEAATRSFANYRNAELKSNSATKWVFVFNGELLEPVWEFKDGRLVSREFPQDLNREFRGRGSFYNLYSQGGKTGTVVTEAQFDCRPQKCPLTTFARHISLDGLLADGSGIATNFNLTKRVNPVVKVTSLHAATLRKLAVAWVNSNAGTPAYKKALRQRINQESETGFFSGTYTKDGKAMLIGNWVIGSMNDQHYGADDDIYESLLIIAEQQNGGTFRIANGSGSISDNGCSYLDHLDIDSDGVEEIFLQCNQLEGSYSYGFLKRVNGKWMMPSIPQLQ